MLFSENTALYTELNKELRYYIDTCRTKPIAFQAYYGPALAYKMIERNDTFDTLMSRINDMVLFDLICLAKICLVMVSCPTAKERIEGKKKLAEMNYRIDKAIANDKSNANIHIAKKIVQFYMGSPAAENVVTAAAPIVQYNGETLKDQEVTLDKVAETAEDVNAEADLAKALVILFKNNFDAIVNSTCVLPDIRGFESLIAHCMRHNHDAPSAELYFALAYYAEVIKHSQVHENYLGRILSGDLFDQSCEAMLTEIENSGVEASDDTLADKVEDASHTDVPYKVDLLKGYIDQHRELRASVDAANSIINAGVKGNFAHNPKATIVMNQLSYNGIPIAEYDNKMLIAPVIDMANGNKPTIIVLNRNGVVYQTDSLMDLK